MVCPEFYLRYIANVFPVIEDFFRLLLDALIYYHQQFIPAAICSPILSAAISALSLQQLLPLVGTLHYLRDLLSYGTDHPNSSSFHDQSDSAPAPTDPKIRTALDQLITAQGKDLVRALLTGMMFSFPDDCLQDASAVLLSLFELKPQQTAMWVKGTIEMLPAGSVKAGEGDRLFNAIGQKIQDGEPRKIRMLLQDFTTSYRRRNVAPREGLGRLAGARFRFTR